MRGGDPRDLKNQLGALFRATMQQIDTLRVAVVQRGKIGRMQVDLALLRRRRRELLADLGEAVAQLAVQGRIDEADYPELDGPFQALEELDERIATEEHKVREASGVHDDVAPAEWERAAADAAAEVARAKREAGPPEHDTLDEEEEGEEEDERAEDETSFPFPGARTVDAVEAEAAEAEAEATAEAETEATAEAETDAETVDAGPDTAPEPPPDERAPTRRRGKGKSGRK